MVFEDDAQDLILGDEMEDSDYGQRLHMFGSEPSRCLLLTKGPEGVIQALKHLVGPKSGESEDEIQGEEIEEDEDDFTTRSEIL